MGASITGCDVIQIFEVHLLTFSFLEIIFILLGGLLFSPLAFVENQQHVILSLHSPGIQRPDAKTLLAAGPSCNTSLGPPLPWVVAQRFLLPFSFPLSFTLLFLKNLPV